MLAIIILMSPVLSIIAALAPDEGETGNTFFETIPAVIFNRLYSLRALQMIAQDFCI